MKKIGSFVFGSRIVLGIAIALSLVGCKKIDKPVARVGNSSITQSQFEETYMKQRSITAGLEAPLSDKKKVLDEMISHRLQVLAAKSQGLDRDPQFQKKIKLFRDQTLFWAVMEADVVPQVIPENQIRNIWKHSNIDLKLRHILLRLPAKAPKKQVDSTMALAQRLVQQIRSGADFGELAKKYSSDKATADRGGALGYIKWRQLDPAVREVVFRLKRYDITDPLKTNQGIEIIQVLERRIFPRQPYEIARTQILNNLIREHSRQLSQVYQSYWKNLQKKYNVTWYNKNIKFLADSLHMPHPLKKKKGFAPDTTGPFSAFSAQEMKRPLVTYRGGKITLEDFARIVGKGPKHFLRQPIRGARGIRNILDGELRNKIILIEGRHRGLLKKARYQKQIRDYVDSQLYQEARKRNVLQKVVVTDSLARKYYRSHLGLYKDPPKVKVQVIMVKDKKLADRVYHMALKGQNFTRLAEKYNQMASTKKTKGMLGFIGINSYGLIGNEAFRAKIGEIRGPLKMGTNYYIIKVLKRRPERQKNYEEARFDVERDLRTQLTKKLQKEWMAKLRKEMPVVIFEKNLKETFKEYKTDEI